MSAGSAIRAVVDTNLVVSGLISTRGAPYRLIQLLHAGAFDIVVTDVIRGEYEDVLSRPFLARYGEFIATDSAAFLRFVNRHAITVDPLDIDQLPLVVRDPKDNDLLVLAGDPRLATLQIVTAREFLAVIRAA